MFHMLFIDYHRTREKGRVATVHNFPDQSVELTARELRALAEKLLDVAKTLDVMNTGKGKLRCVCGQMFDPGPPDRLGHIKEFCPDCDESINYIQDQEEQEGWGEEKDPIRRYLEDERWLS